MAVSEKKVVAPKIYSYYDRPEDPGLDMQSLPGDSGKSMTHQSFKDECDINKIFERYLATGGLPNANQSAPVYGDYSNVNDYQTSLNIVMESQERFMALPARVRSRFDNDPAKLLAFVNDKANREEAIELGLIDRPPVPFTVDGKVYLPDPKGGQPILQGPTPPGADSVPPVANKKG